ncbi:MULTISPECIES: PfkB family carbohydrate kinase [unclassified Anaeromyxobacter]|uniref:PfkB family carbohydrate kinase n=1 Tax=unclassified Anaeromyxobacter TaxID=2620896 RepID=UPI001F5A00F5|nr:MULTISPECIES: PfkB family carbohydrate kinase [unclassified Anaeromyxobacter]
MSLRIAVIGHVEHVTIGRVPAVPAAGDIVHLDGPRWFPGGGGGVAFWQLVRSPAELHLFTAIGDDAAGDAVAAELAASGAHVHAVRRAEPHTRAIAMVDPAGERTILVVGEPLHPRAEDPLPWGALAGFDAAYFTAQDPAALRAARAARVLVVAARRRPALAASGVRADAVVGSVRDPREASRRADHAVPPVALVLTDGARGGRIETEEGLEVFEAPPSPPRGGGAYGAGDSFAAALTFFLAAGVPLAEACRRAGLHGAAVLGGLDPRTGQLPLEDPR